MVTGERESRTGEISYPPVHCSKIQSMAEGSADPDKRAVKPKTKDMSALVALTHQASDILSDLLVPSQGSRTSREMRKGPIS